MSTLLIRFVPQMHHPCTEKCIPPGPSLFFIYFLYLCPLVLLSTLISKNLCANIAYFSEKRWKKDEGRMECYVVAKQTERQINDSI